MLEISNQFYASCWLQVQLRICNQMLKSLMIRIPMKSPFWRYSSYSSRTRHVQQRGWNLVCRHGSTPNSLAAKAERLL